MSGAEDTDRAGLFVLGALNAEEMRELRREAERDPELARAIEAWERRLAPLAVLAPEVAPPDTLWEQLDARVARLSGQAAEIGEVYSIPHIRKKPRRRSAASGGSGAGALVYNLWRGAAVGGMALAASLAAVLYMRQPESPRHSIILPAGPGVGGWLITLHHNGEVEAQAQGALTHTLSQDFELWALPDGSDRPLPLGLLQQTNTTTLKTGSLPTGKFALLVSLEPKGGSPSGVPTGPVMFAGNVEE